MSTALLEIPVSGRQTATIGRDPDALYEIIG